MKHKIDQGKRRLLKGGAVLAGGTLGNALPAGAVIAISQNDAKKGIYKAPLFDPTLENYPGYSTHVPLATSVEVASAAHNLLDTQFIV